MPRRHAEGGQRAALGGELPGNPGASRAEGRADRDLPAPARGAGEQKVRDVGAGDREQETDGREEDEQRRPRVPDLPFMERRDAGAHEPVGLGIETLEPGRDRFELRLRGGGRHARGEPAHDAQHVRAAEARLRPLFGVHAEGAPVLDVS